MNYGTFENFKLDLLVGPTYVNYLELLLRVKQFPMVIDAFIVKYHMNCKKH